MRINIIGGFLSKGLSQDSGILRGLISNQYPHAEIRKILYYLPECPEAEINIFLEVMNPALIHSASRNILIPNPEWTYKTWIPYIEMMDEIWVKTQEAKDIFSQYSSKVKYIGWTSIDKIFEEKKNYSKAIVLVGKNIYRNPKQLLRAYYKLFKEQPSLFQKLPQLYIPYNSKELTIFCPPELSSKVFLLEELTESKYDELLHECGLAICLSTCEGYGHAINEAMSAGCLLFLSPIKPFKELTNYSTDVLWGKELQTIDHPKCLGKIIDTTTESICENLEDYINLSWKEKKKLSVLFRTFYETNHKKFIQSFSIPTLPEFHLSKLFVSENDLPCISIITLTYNRKEFLPLAKYSYLIQSYPPEKLEWILINDGESIEDLLFGIPNLKYIELKEKVSISEKRNLAIEASMYDYICIMDDDDVYPNNSILTRISMLLREPKKECTFSTTIPCYDINKKVSFMNVPPLTLEMSERVSEATLCFTKQFWKERKFEGLPEGDKFIRGREQMCREISPQNVIVSLIHSKNISSRKSPTEESNGSHYGFCDELFLLLEQISSS